MRTFKKILAAMLACTMLLSAGAALAEGETVTINFCIITAPNPPKTKR